MIFLAFLNYEIPHGLKKKQRSLVNLGLNLTEVIYLTKVKNTSFRVFLVKIVPKEDLKKNLYFP